jgi:hypothetical protein
MTSFNIYEAYAAVYNEDLREEILTVEEDFSFIDDLSDNELVQVMEEILSEREVTLDECFDAFDADLLSEETEMQRMNRLQNKATREKKGSAATAGRMKSAERERVGRKHAIKRLQVATSRAADNLKSNVKSKSERAKTLAGGVASAVAGGAAEAGRKAKSGVEKVKGKLASAKEKIKGFIKSGRKAVAGGLRGLASKVEPKEATGKEVKTAAKETVSRRASAASKASKAAEGTRGTSVVQGQPSGTFASKKSRVQAQKREARLTASENYEILADTILENLINEGYAETFEEALNVLESFSDYEVGEIAENYLVEETVDLYDVVLEHLLDEGFADTEEAATVIMANMSEEWREEILEVKMDPRGRPASGPMNVYANPKGKPDQAHLDAIKAYDEKQKKKTPEQKKAELDAYIERQRNR